MRADASEHRTNLDGSALWQVGLPELSLQRHARPLAGCGSPCQAGAMEVNRDGAALLAAGCLPFVAGALVPADGHTPWPPCPLRTFTGLPCPLCGATRAFALAARGDAGFASFNGFWVLVAVLVIVAGAAALLTNRSPIEVLVRSSRRTALTVGLLGACGWAWALAERATIVSQGP